MLTTLAGEAALDHPLLVERREPKRAGVLVVSSDRGLCGAYNSSIFRRSEQLFALLREEGKEPVLYTVGRKALGYYTFRNWDIAESWTGFSEQPQYENAAEIASTLVERVHGGRRGRRRSAGRRRPAGVDELHIVYHGVQVDDVADGGGPPDGSRWSWSTSRKTPGRAPCTRSSRTRRRCSRRCCRGT